LWILIRTKKYVDPPTRKIVGQQEIGKFSLGKEKTGKQTCIGGGNLNQFFVTLDNPSCSM